MSAPATAAELRAQAEVWIARLGGARHDLAAALMAARVRIGHPDTGHVVARLHGAKATADRAHEGLVAQRILLGDLPPTFLPSEVRQAAVRSAVRSARGAESAGRGLARGAQSAFATLDGGDAAGYARAVRAFLAAPLVRPAGTAEEDAAPAGDDEPQSVEDLRESKTAALSSEAAASESAQAAHASRLGMVASLGGVAVNFASDLASSTASRRASERADYWEGQASRGASQGAAADRDADDIIVRSGRTLAPPPGFGTTRAVTSPPTTEALVESEPPPESEAPPESELDPVVEAEPEPDLTAMTEGVPSRRPSRRPTPTSSWKKPLLIGTAVSAVVALSVAVGLLARRPPPPPPESSR